MHVCRLLCVGSRNKTVFWTTVVVVVCFIVVAFETMTENDVLGLNVWTRGCLQNLPPPISTPSPTAPESHDLKTENTVVDRRRTIVYSCRPPWICGGLADRQKGVVTAYVISAMLNRRFKVDMRYPCDVSLYLAPNKVDWVLRQEDMQNVTVGDLDGIDNHGYYFVLEMLKKDDPGTMPGLDKDVVMMTSNMELVHLLKQHKLAQNIPWLSSDKSLGEIYRHVLLELFTLTELLQSKLTNFLQARPPNTKLACAQIRMGGKSAAFNDTEEFGTLADVQNLFHFLAQYNDSQTYRIFFASDNEQVLNLAKASFPRTFLQTAGPITHVDKTEGHDACAGLGRAMADQLILSTCDVLVISESGMGKIPAFLRNTDEDLFLFTKATVSKYWRNIIFPNRIWW